MPGFEQRDRIALYVHLRAFESDFDKSQGQIRAISAAWAGAVLAAIGYLSVNLAQLPAGTNVGADIIQRRDFLVYFREALCFVGSLGTFAFWFVDQRVYQRLLHSTYAYGLYLEFRNPDLPQIRSGVYRANLDITNSLGAFYRVQFWALIVLSWLLIATSWGSAPHEIFYAPFGFTLAAVVLELFTHRWGSLDEVIQSLYPELWAVLPRIDRPNQQAIDEQWLARIRARPMPPEPDAPAPGP